MSSLVESNRFLRLSLVGPCVSISFVAPMLAHHLGITTSEAIFRLSSPAGLLSDRLEKTHAKRVANLLAAFGVSVRLEQSVSGVPSRLLREVFFDISIQPPGISSVERLAKDLVRKLPPNLWAGATPEINELCRTLAGPSGLVFEHIKFEQVQDIRRRLRKNVSAMLSTSNSATALYDIMPDSRILGGELHALVTDLKYLGLSPCTLTGALAARIDTKTRDHVMKRFGARGLFSLNRDFQRFDLFLTGYRKTEPNDLIDFLVARSDMPRHVLERVRCPVRIEKGLNRANVMLFQSDYLALGLKTRARLRGSPRFGQTSP